MLVTALLPIGISMLISNKEEKMSKLIKIALWWFCAIAIHAYGDNHKPDGTITYDPSTDGYIFRFECITYNEKTMIYSKAGMREEIFLPAKIVPRVKSTFNLRNGRIVSYRYEVSNDQAGKHSIERFVLPGVFGDHIVSEKEEDVFSPINWSGWADAEAVNWKMAERRGIAPGERATGYLFLSFDLPGIISAKLSGEGECINCNVEANLYCIPPESGAYADESYRIETGENYKPYPVAAPMVAIPNPFNAAELVDRIRAHVATWPNFKTGGYNGNVPPDKKIFLLDSAFAAKLDGYLSSAANAFRLNNPKAAKEHIETIRKMLAKEHHNLDHDDEDSDDVEERETVTRLSIDRLAARVLDFDLRYVLKHTEREHEENKGK